MAKVWPVREGKQPNTGEPWADLPLEEAARILELTPRFFLADLGRPPHFGDADRDLWWRGYQHVVVEIGGNESRDPWRPGFYKSPLSPAAAHFRLQVHNRFGAQWRDEWKTGPDSDGEPAIWLAAVLKVDAPESEWAWENRERIRARVRDAAAESGVSEWVFVRFRKEMEETPVA
jgi:hypothetical protein